MLGACVKDNSGGSHKRLPSERHHSEYLWLAATQKSCWPETVYKSNKIDSNKKKKKKAH